VSNLVAFVLDGLDDLHLFRDAGLVRQHFLQSVGPTWIFAACFTKRSKKPSSRGKSRCKSPGICGSPLKSPSEAEGR
jgi:hypothetical protein